MSGIIFEEDTKLQKRTARHRSPKTSSGFVKYSVENTKSGGKYLKPILRQVSPTNLATAEKMARRVIAPYVNMVRKGTKVYMKRAGDRYNFYLTKKSKNLMKSLLSFITNKDDLPGLLSETVEILKGLTDSLGARLFFIDKSTDQLYLYQKNVPYPKCRVNYPIGPGSSVASYVAFTREYVCVKDITCDDRFPEGVHYKNEVKAVLCVPVVSDLECYAVVEFYKGLWQPPFSKQDLKIVVLVGSWIGLTIHQNTDGVQLHKKQEVNDDLQRLVLEYFGSPYTLENLLGDILNYTKYQLSAERGSFYLLSKHPDGLLADVYEEGIGEVGVSLIKKNLRVRIGNERTVPSMVAVTGELLNVRDVYNDERFEHQVIRDNELNVICRSVLCMPIKNQTEVMGIICVINKKNAMFFTDEDELLIGIIATYVCMALHYANTENRNKMAGLQLQQCRDLLEFHLKPCSHNVDKMSEEYVVPKNIREYSWYIVPEDVALMPQLYTYMVTEIIGSDNIDSNNLNLFILTVQCSYRDNPYHNFEHAFNVAHCMFVILSRNKEKFSLIEREALIIAAITHDIDHAGYTNNFLVVTKHLFSQLYDESPWENHHVFVTMHILAKYQIFTNLQGKVYDQFLGEVTEDILFTDLAYYFKARTKLVEMVRTKTFILSNPVHKSLTRSMMMTIADLAGQFKPFGISKKITDQLYLEFYKQGDMEKKMGVSPLGIMDRDNQCQVPDNQIQFLNIVVMVCADIMKSILPNTAELYENSKVLRDTWKRIIETRGTKIWRQCDSVST